MAKKLTAKQVVKELNDIVFSFSGKSIGTLVQEGWARLQQTRIGDAAAPVERAARALDPYAVLGLPKESSLEDVKRRYRQLAEIYHPDKEGGFVEAMKLVNNAYEEIERKRGG